MSDEKPSTHFEHYRIAKTHEKNGRLKEALESYSKALEISVDYAHAWFYKGKLLYKMENYKDCIDCAERALKLAPNWGDHINKLLSDARSRTEA